MPICIRHERELIDRNSEMNYNLPSLDLFFLVDSSSLLELGRLVHENECWQRRCREDKFLGVHIN